MKRNAGAFLVGLLCGFVVYAVFDAFTQINIDWEGKVSLFDIVNTLVTLGIGLFVAIYIGHILRYREDSRRVEKDRMIARTEEIAFQAKEVQGAISRYGNQPSELSEINSEFRKLSSMTANLESKLKTFELYEIACATFKEVERHLEHYRHIVGEPEFSMLEADKEYQKLANELDLLIRSINRANT